MEIARPSAKIEYMTQIAPVDSPEEIQKGLLDLTLRVGQLEAEKGLLEQENKSLRFMLERVIDHRQKSHSELVLLLTGLVSRLQISDVGAVVSKLVEHNTNVNQYLAALIKGTPETHLPEPAILKTLDLARKDLAAALKPVVEELIELEAPLEKQMLQAVLGQPEQFFAPRNVRANRCFIKGQVPKERVLREFGEPALVFFNDLTTDPKLNPNPKPDEIALAFKSDFETLFAQQPALLSEKREDLLKLFHRVQRSKASTEQARCQKNAFTRLSFLVELLRYYENQSTEVPDVLFAQRLPALIEQLVISGPQDNLDEKLIAQAEGLIAFVINPDHRLMIINNVGKSGAAAKTLKYVMRVRFGQAPDQDQIIVDFVKHLISLHKTPNPEQLAAILRLLKPDIQIQVVKTIFTSDRMRKQDAETLGKALGDRLGLKDVEKQLKVPELSPEADRQLAWSKIKDLIAQRAEPASVAATIRDRLHAKYDAEEIKQSWVTLIDADAISLIRIFCQLPYRADGQTDAIARAVMETYVTRLIHEKYATAYGKVVNSLRNMFKTKPDSPTLLNFLALVKWVHPEAANKICADIGMPPAAP
jgi:hypothetical protein